MDIFTDILRIILTSLVSIAVLFCLCKLIGQRQISQMSMFDYINSITVGSIAAEFATELEKLVGTAHRHHCIRPCDRAHQCNYLQVHPTSQIFQRQAGGAV